MGEVIETALDDDIFIQLNQIKNERDGFFIEILKEVIKKGLRE